MQNRKDVVRTYGRCLTLWTVHPPHAFCHGYSWLLEHYEHGVSWTVQAGATSPYDNDQQLIMP